MIGAKNLIKYMFVEIKHHFGELWIKDVDCVKFENVKMVTFWFDNRSDFDEVKELFEQIRQQAIGNEGEYKIE